MIKKLTKTVFNLAFPNRKFSVREVSRFGARLLVYIDQHTGRKIALRFFERDETNFLRRFVKSNYVCLDIGSNIGYFAVLFASKGAKVYSFDPVLENFALQTLTCALNPKLSIELRNCAVSESCGMVGFSIPDQTSLARIDANSTAAGEDKRMVDMIAIDELDLPRVDVIKIDVEGAEEMVIKGMQDTLQRCKPKLIMVELVDEHLSAFGSSTAAVFDLLRSNNMSPMVLEDGALAPYVRGGAKNDNFFFVQKNSV